MANEIVSIEHTFLPAVEGENCKRVYDGLFEYEHQNIRLMQDHCVDDFRPDVIYVYDVYRFSLDDVVLKARSYEDTPSEASILGMEMNGKPQLLQRSDLSSPLAKAARSYLLSIGKTKLSWLDQTNVQSGYSKLE